MKKTLILLGSSLLLAAWCNNDSAQDEQTLTVGASKCATRRNP